MRQADPPPNGTYSTHRGKHHKSALSRPLHQTEGHGDLHGQQKDDQKHRDRPTERQEPQNSGTQYAHGDDGLEMIEGTAVGILGGVAWVLKMQPNPPIALLPLVLRYERRRCSW